MLAFKSKCQYKLASRGQNIKVKNIFVSVENAPTDRRFANG